MEKINIQEQLTLSVSKLCFKKYFSYRGVTCKILTNLQDHEDWISHYFQPYYDIDTKEDKMYIVYSIVDQYLYKCIIQAVSFDCTSEILSHHYKKAEECFLENDFQVIIYRQSGFLIISNVAKREFWLVTDGINPDVKYEPARIVREIFTRELEKQGFFLMHAAVVEKEGKAYVMCGDKGAGKTTCFLGLLEYGYNIVANDKLYIGYFGDQLIAIGWPGAVAITLQTMLFFNKLKNVLLNLENLRFPQWRLDKKLNLFDSSNFAFDNTNKVDLTVVETANIFNVKVVREAPVEKIIFLSSEKTQFGVTMVSAEEGYDILKSNLKYPIDPSYPDMFKMRQNDEDITKAINQMVNDVSNSKLIYRFYGKRSIVDDVLAIKNILHL